MDCGFTKVESSTERGIFAADELAPESMDEIQDQRKKRAEQKGSRQGEIDRAMFASPGKITRESAKRQPDPACEKNEAACHEQHHSREDQPASNFIHGSFQPFCFFLVRRGLPCQLQQCPGLQQQFFGLHRLHHHAIGNL